ncbi:MAG: type II secretion system F family protein [Ruthenibacterium sp.]
MTYQYVAVDAAGKRAKGELDATGETEAIAQLRARHLVPTSLSAGKKAFGMIALDEGKNIWNMDFAPKDPHVMKFKRKKMILIFNQMAIMLRAGVNLSLLLEVMEENEPHKGFARVLHELHSDMLSGVSLSASMEKFACFDAVTTNLVRAGEADGHLERSFAQIATVYEKQDALIGKVRSAMIYPVILIVLVLVVLAIINTVVLPSFYTMFEAMGTGVPAITMAVMAVSNFTTRWWWLIALVIVGLVALYRFTRKKSHAFCMKVDRAKLYLPLVGKLMKNVQIARFSRILSTMLYSGQDFLSALAISRAVLTNQYLINGLEQVADEVRVGNPVSASMDKQGFFDPVFISMLRAGEESGSLSETLGKMADLYETETDESTKRLTTAMEPLMTIVIAIIVGFVVIAVAVPMFSMFDLVGTI